jgi:hypothetical protein
MAATERRNSGYIFPHSIHRVFELSTFNLPPSIEASATTLDEAISRFSLFVPFPSSLNESKSERWPNKQLVQTNRIGVSRTALACLFANRHHSHCLKDDKAKDSDSDSDRV